jgi:alginate O-acetyltransferase complex protein AlgI
MRPSILPVLVIVSLLPLIGFKYTHFLLSNLDALLGTTWQLPAWSLPLGISFVTFTVISLIVDSAKRPSLQQPSLLETAVYVTFFPHLIAGPILRAPQMVPQIPQMRIAIENLVPCLALFTVGILKKVVIADPLGSYVDLAYANTSSLGSIEAALASLAFTIQIYCDFSAYSDMAIALAAFLSIKFPENFHSPFLASSMNDFWRRWHMTLSFWLRDYVFTPLYKRLRTVFPALAYFLTMFISGLWHGAGWNFLFWGSLLGLILLIEHITGWNRRQQSSKGLLRTFGIALTFLLFLLSLVFFRSPSMTIAGDVFSALVGLNGFGTFPEAGTLVLALCSVSLILHNLDQKEKIMAAGKIAPAWILVPICTVAIFACAIIAAGRPEAFYYFDF